ncbi:MAG TPA: cytochrome c-type biogenesis protein CcmH [Candidatus Acidoferrum sp.]|jgi:cytochrome c-type biogenesis protein CcmH/NrfF|nr:cytochrome c-type biogenesis protein CcmH [Candidatus Acidoferrum sp.]
MTKLRRIRRPGLLILPVALCFAGALPLLSAFGDAQQLDHTHQLGMKVKCMCGGCNDSAGGCYHVGGAFSGPCDTALGMLKKIDERIAQGNSDDLIVQSFVQEYGQAVLTEPPHSGFGRVAWWIPALALIGGFVLVLSVISRWRNRPGAEPALVTAGNAPAVSSELLERARAQAARDTED